VQRKRLNKYRVPDTVRRQHYEAISSIEIRVLARVSVCPQMISHGHNRYACLTYRERQAKGSRDPFKWADRDMCCAEAVSTSKCYVLKPPSLMIEICCKTFSNYVRLLCSWTAMFISVVGMTPAPSCSQTDPCWSSPVFCLPRGSRGNLICLSVIAPSSCCRSA
jgi:hypothetical protein